MFWVKGTSGRGISGRGTSCQVTILAKERSWCDNKESSLFTCWAVTSDTLSIEISSLGCLQECFALAMRASFSWNSRSVPEEGEVTVCCFPPVGPIAGRPCFPVAFGLAPCKR